MSTGDSLSLGAEFNDLLSFVVFDPQEKDCDSQPSSSRLRNCPLGLSNLSGIFQGCVFTFWVKSHVGLLVQKTIDVGGVVKDSVDAQTTHIVVPDGIDAEEIKDNLLKEGIEISKLTQFHAFVPASFISDSIGQGHRLDENAYGFGNIHVYMNRHQPTAGKMVKSRKRLKSHSPDAIQLSCQNDSPEHTLCETIIGAEADNNHVSDHQREGMLPIYH